MKTILLIEDEELLAKMYRDKFERTGFKVLLSRTAEEGVELAKKEKPDLVVLDIILPENDGLFFLRKIRQEKSSIKDVPVIAFSNYDNPDTRKEARQLKVNDYIIKANHDPEEIVSKINKYFDHQ
jgi:DNA-binding response OmpR family regulator